MHRQCGHKAVRSEKSEDSRAMFRGCSGPRPSSQGLPEVAPSLSPPFADGHEAERCYRIFPKSPASNRQSPDLILKPLCCITKLKENKLLKKKLGLTDSQRNANQNEEEVASSATQLQFEMRVPHSGELRVRSTPPPGRQGTNH